MLSSCPMTLTLRPMHNNGLTCAKAALSKRERVANSIRLAQLATWRRPWRASLLTIMSMVACGALLLGGEWPTLAAERVRQEFAAAGAGQALAEPAEGSFTTSDLISVTSTMAADTQVLGALGVGTLSATSASPWNPIPYELSGAVPRRWPVVVAVAIGRGLPILHGRAPDADRLESAIGPNLLPMELEEGLTVQIDGYDFPVVGVIDAGGPLPIARGSVFVSPRAASFLNQQPDLVTITAYLAETADPNETARRLGIATRFALPDKPPRVSLTSVGTLETAVGSRLDLLIARVALLTASLALVGVLALTGLDIRSRAEEAFVRWAIGATKMETAHQALLEAVTTGLTGSSIGALLAGALIRLLGAEGSGIDVGQAFAAIVLVTSASGIAAFIFARVALRHPVAS